MIKVRGSYSGYDYEYGQGNHFDKWILKRTDRYGDREPKTYLFDSEEEVLGKIYELESMFDHRSDWD